MKFKMGSRFDHACLPMYRFNWDVPIGAHFNTSHDKAHCAKHAMHCALASAESEILLIGGQEPHWLR